MPTSCQPIDGAVRLTYEGSVSGEELVRVALEAIALLRSSGHLRLLADLTRLSGGHSPGDLFGVVDLLEHSGLPRTLREAMVVSPATASLLDVQYFEDACRNRGWNVRIFTDEAGALAWLREP